MQKRSLYGVLCCVVLYLYFSGCQTGVEPSPNPGILRITLKADEADTTIIIQSDTSRFSRWDEFYFFISQGRLYRGRNYALLYADLTIERTPGTILNILQREWLNGAPIKPTDVTEINTKNSRYSKSVIFESYVPPGDYDSLSFALIAYEILTFVPKVYQNPVQLPMGTAPQIQFPAHITVHEDRVTQIDIEISPFRSLSRYRDSFLFDRKIKIIGVQNL
ncbi:MAG: hypothetical protein HY088_05585 [Ignavibacteriales bacterium]|nr:hypothetical protein [Ignavibacteriales bacterium]